MIKHILILFLFLSFSPNVLIAIGPDDDAAGAAGGSHQLVRTQYWTDDEDVGRRVDGVVPHPKEWSRYFHIYGVPELEVRVTAQGPSIVYRTGSKSADVAHVGTVAWNTYSMVDLAIENLIRRVPALSPLYAHLQSMHEAFRQSPPVAIFPYGVEMWNAYYDPSWHEMVFGTYKDPRTGRTEYTCRSTNIGVHEMSHDILGRIWWNLFSYGELEPVGFHEGFSDGLSTLFSIIRDPFARAKISASASGDLHQAESLRELGERFGRHIAEKYGGATDEGLRDIGADVGLPNRLKEASMKRATREVHDYGHAWASSFFDVLSDAYTTSLSRGHILQSPDVELYNVAKGLLDITLCSVATAQHLPGVPSFSGIATEMWRHAGQLEGLDAPDVPWQGLIEKHFTRHGITVKTTGAEWEIVAERRGSRGAFTVRDDRFSTTMTYISALQGGQARGALEKRRQKAVKRWDAKTAWLRRAQPRSAPR